MFRPESGDVGLIFLHSKSDLSLLSLSRGSLKTLRHLGVTTLAQLMALDPMDILESSKAGDFSAIEEIQQALQKSGLRWKTYEAKCFPPEKYRKPKWSLRYQPAKFDLVLNRAGGRPSSWGAGSRWPKCKHCSGPMRFLFQLLGQESGGQLDFPGKQALQVFCCERTDGQAACPVAKPFSGANLAVFRDQIHSKVLSSSQEAMPVYEISLEPGFDDLRVSPEFFPAFEAQNATQAKWALECSRVDRFGGAAPLSRANQIDCAGCFQPMQFYAQFSDPAVSAPFTSGKSYLLSCQDCMLLAFQHLS